MSVLHPGDCHAFDAAGQRFLYLAPSAAVMAIDDVSAAILDAVAAEPQSVEDLTGALSDRYAAADVGESVAELIKARALRRSDRPERKMPKVLPLVPVPLSTMVLNVTNQCNLSCTYCYEYGEDKIVQTENGRQPKWMSEQTARESVDFMLREADREAHLTFFGGETLMNFKVLQTAVAYATERAAALGKTVDFSLTTNATLLKPEVIEFLAEHRFGVTISIDGPKDLQNKFRVFQKGAGSYDLVAPNIKALIARHRSRPIGARVTLTRETLQVRRIYEHLTQELGFWEVGFAPVTAAPGRTYAFDEAGFEHVLDDFRDLAQDYLAAALENRHHGFSNVRETLGEIHKGASKAWPCGAGFGLLGVSTAGDVNLCHRFAGSDDHKLGTVRDGIDREAQRAFLDAHHIAEKTDCHTCWARPLCSGGCYHEAHTRTGTTTRPNLHYCEWIRGWTDTCLKIYGEIAQKNPAFLQQFDGAHDEAPQPS
ncbi:MAG TPA: quinohemoprotein amine dehydrogenase maturation protein [Vicinamibacterales bacterium]|nr:quinohemoprotein amine dehydrogenase maturation protein [Vicinamibacterales bacterium]